MKRISALLLTLVLSAIVSNDFAAAQASADAAINEKCVGDVHKAVEVSRPAKITARPEPSYTDEARAHGVRGRVVLTAVMCWSGKVTDIKVIETLPFGMTERAIQAARQMKFIPAEKDGQRVSQRIQIEYNFNQIGDRRPLAQEAIGRMIESVEISGYWQVPEDEIWKQVKSQTGETISVEQVQRDLQAILALGYFDTNESYVRVEEGTRGGVKVFFCVKELSWKTLPLKLTEKTF